MIFFSLFSILIFVFLTDPWTELFSVKSFSRSGLFYSFENRPVVRKFQSQKQDRSIFPAQVELYKKEHLQFVRENFQTRTSKRTGHPESVVFAQFKARFVSPWDRVSSPLPGDFLSEASPSDSPIDPSNNNNLFISPRAETIFYVQAEFKNSQFLFLDLIPKEEIIVPTWAQSLDFWVQNEHEDLQLFFYFKYPDLSKSRYSLVLEPQKYWQKLYLNLYANQKQPNSKKKTPIQLTQIRLAKPDKNQKQDPFFTVFFTQPQIYSYTKNLNNLYQDPHRSFENFEQSSDWKLEFLNESRLKESSKTDSEEKNEGPQGNVLSHPSATRSFKNKRYFSLKVLRQTHQNQDMILRFPDGKHFLKEGEGLSFWARGSGESISAILEDANQDLIEWKLVDLYFPDWRKFQVLLPKNSELKNKPFRYWIDPLSRKPYLHLLALRISPPLQDMNLSLDEIQSFTNPQ